MPRAAPKIKYLQPKRPTIMAAPAARIFHSRGITPSMPKAPSVSPSMISPMYRGTYRFARSTTSSRTMPAR